LTVNETFSSPERQVWDVASALLHLPPRHWRAAIGPLIATIERVVAGEDRPGGDREMIPDPTLPLSRQIDRVSR